MLITSATYISHVSTVSRVEETDPDGRNSYCRQLRIIRGRGDWPARSVFTDVTYTIELTLCARPGLGNNDDGAFTER
jgi:hypothetical protein